MIQGFTPGVHIFKNIVLALKYIFDYLYCFPQNFTGCYFAVKSN